ncbi:hypothetical protein H2204_014896 [Knufia peltigerae]|uniref:Xylanolytic transcriptional activator regulatory domain-containing protein n=1 Tax=Knufia peltigerae TaxID=1002370 RepID=A0AA38XG93_9EURO|nr:hypothetical protein H2204_014896 [Knufia peltigerae]
MHRLMMFMNAKQQDGRDESTSVRRDATSIPPDQLSPPPSRGRNDKPSTEVPGSHESMVDVSPTVVSEPQSYSRGNNHGLLGTEMDIPDVIPWEMEGGLTPFLSDNYINDAFITQDLSGLNAEVPSDSQGLELSVSHQTDRQHLLSPRSPADTSQAQHPTRTLSASQPRLYQLTVSNALLRELVDVFFSKINAFLPIFHKPRFYQQYFPNEPQHQGLAHRRLPLESALILNGIMSLSARFAQPAEFDGVPPIARGALFAKEAQSIYADAIRSQGEEAPTLPFLQGCILLAFYHSTNCSNTFQWALIGSITRLAYDLGINSVDEDISAHHHPDEQPQWASVEDWVHREELRRAWWAIWELDTFASTVSKRPYMIDRNTMRVLLPVSDEHWFAGHPVASAPMGCTPSTAWKSLQNSPNQDERAWFLIANFLMALANDLMIRGENVQKSAKEEMELAITCFSLSLPEQFRLTCNALVFNDTTFARSNWIIATNIMLQR